MNSVNSGAVKVATCQFPVSADIASNASFIRTLMRQAAEQGAEIVHFSECALSGYAGVDFDSFEGYNWDLLAEKTHEIIALSGALHIWTVLGSTHRLTEPHKPHNSLYLISPDGQLADRYDKRFCTENDLSYYTPGSHFSFFNINDVKCSLLICFDLRFPELYRAL
ncbi:MAG TPA: carbon-nitrogen hydrolase family protein, partial [Anaerohalosphaeraceae bacterium]|nr:carbon-nitrogen hydrolase family protein [Anaerohalosphaeraceae bacterium]